MGKKTVATLWFMVALLFAFGQDSIYFKHHVIRIDNADSLDEKVYKAISSYRLIMAGELHCTNEPAGFVIKLADLFTRRGIPVQIGIEIPSEQMEKFLLSPCDSNIYTSEFFTTSSFDTRPSYAWADMIAKLNDNPNAAVFFYDANSDEFTGHNDRDSLMYLKIKKAIQLHPDRKTIVLGGNIHMMLKPFDGKPKMAVYLENDNDLNLSGKLLSVDHIFSTGMLRSNGDRTLYRVDNSGSFFAKMVGFNSYFFLYPPGSQKPYNALYFTRKVTPSKLVTEK
jgi:hypothetical protein